MRDLIEAAGFPRPAEDKHDLGFVYYGRHFRSADGSVPPAFGPLLQHYESFSTLTLPADNGTWAVVVVASGNDRLSRSLLDVERWTNLVRSVPLVAHWLEGEPIDEGVHHMGAIEDRYRHFCPDGAAAAPGVLPLGDAYACTNPSVGRGISIGLMHGVALRALLREADLADARGLSLAWDAVTEREVAPYVRDTLRFDAHRLAEIEAQIAGVPYETDDPYWQRHQTLFGNTTSHPDLLRGVLEIMSAYGPEREVLDRPDLSARIDEFAGKPVDPLPGPSRPELETILGA
jgi:flavin-dependent dehydrogenase